MVHKSKWGRKSVWEKEVEHTGCCLQIIALRIHLCVYIWVCVTDATFFRASMILQAIIIILISSIFRIAGIASPVFVSFRIFLFVSLYFFTRFVWIEWALVIHLKCAPPLLRITSIRTMVIFIRAWWLDSLQELLFLNRSFFSSLHCSHLPERIHKRIFTSFCSCVLCMCESLFTIYSLQFVFE